jgi:hypothetical protein
MADVNLLSVIMLIAIMPNVTYKPLMLSVIILNVVMLSVVTPSIMSCSIVVGMVQSVTSTLV